MSSRVSERPAPSMRALSAVVAGYEKISAFSGRRRPPVRPIDRDLRVSVAEVRSRATDVVELRLVPDTGMLPAWQPGAHVDVVLRSGTSRQYSLCENPQRSDEYRIAVRRIAVRRIADGGGGSREMHALRVGDRLTLRGPRNAFPFITTDRYLFVAGGIGITPIRPMLHDAIARGADWALVYTGRARDCMPFLDELQGLDPRRVHIRPDDEYGVPSGATILATAPHGPNQHGAALYCCGPPPMIAAVRAEIPADHIASLHSERFSPPPVLGGEPFELMLAASGRLVQVGAEQSALSAIRAEIPDVAYSCQQGFCGTCPVRVLGGEVEHRDRCLTDAQRNDSMAICVSRGVVRVTVDL